MTKQGFSILLILMMVVSPIASAFDHCVSMDMSDHLSKSQSISVAIPFEETSYLNHQEINMGQQSIQDSMNCHSISNCNYPVCSVYAINLSTLTINTLPSQYEHPGFEFLPPYSTALSPDIRPPIFIL